MKQSRRCYCGVGIVSYMKNCRNENLLTSGRHPLILPENNRRRPAAGQQDGDLLFADKKRLA